MVSGKSFSIRNSLPGLVILWVCVCAFTFTTFSQAAILSWVEVAEEGAPVQEDEENSEKELEVISSARRIKKRCVSCPSYSAVIYNRICPDESSVPVGAVPSLRRLACGLCAPLRV